MLDLKETKDLFGRTHRSFGLLKKKGTTTLRRRFGCLKTKIAD